jgi:methionyl-tRNA formyltransferase
MTSQVGDPVSPSSQNATYPQLSASALAALNEKLVEIVALLQRGELSSEQSRELAASIRTQIANTEKLHQFPLTNANEPAFALTIGVVAHDQ